MQTFLPYPNYADSARVLDNKRLGKQRVECLQILQTLHKGPYTLKNDGFYPSGYTKFIKIKTPWYNHPAVRMWKNYQFSLCFYGIEVCQTWIARGFKDTCLDRLIELYNNIQCGEVVPPWLTPEFCLSHQSNLIRKDPAFYRPIFGPDVPDNLPYVWPIK